MNRETIYMKRQEKMLKVEAEWFGNNIEKFHNAGYCGWLTRIKRDKFMLWWPHGTIVQGDRKGGGVRGQGFNYKKLYLVSLLVEDKNESVIAFYYVNRPCVKRKLKTLGINFKVTKPQGSLRKIDPPRGLSKKRLTLIGA